MNTFWATFSYIDEGGSVLGQRSGLSLAKGMTTVASLQSDLFDRVLDDPSNETRGQIPPPEDVSNIREWAEYLSLSMFACIQPDFHESLRSRTQRFFLPIPSRWVLERGIVRTDIPVSFTLSSTSFTATAWISETRSMASEPTAIIVALRTPPPTSTLSIFHGSDDTFYDKFPIRDGDCCYDSDDHCPSAYGTSHLGDGFADKIDKFPNSSDHESCLRTQHGLYTYRDTFEIGTCHNMEVYENRLNSTRWVYWGVGFVSGGLAVKVVSTVGQYVLWGLAGGSSGLAMEAQPAYANARTVRAKLCL